MTTAQTPPMSKGLEAARALLSKKGVERIAEIFPPSIKNIRPVQGQVRAATLLEKAAGIKGARTQSKLLSSCCDASPFLSEKVQAAPGLLDTPGAIALLYILHLKVCSESLRNSCLAIAHKLGAANVRGLYEEVIDYLDNERRLSCCLRRSRFRESTRRDCAPARSTPQNPSG
jgi:hypothetical protein